MGLPKNKIILSGVQPSGKLHLGNYFGAIRQWIGLQQGNDAAYFIADYHSMTSLQDGGERARLSRELAAALVALGVNPDEAIVYRQSDVPEVHELAWCLSTVTVMGLFERSHAYKDALATGTKPNHGLFAYPALMAADILIHRADLVPVGQDQKQHVEMTRDMAQRFNQAYGDVLVRPDPYVLKTVATVPGTDGGKMSKSRGNVIEMLAAPKALAKQVMGIVTDSTPVEEPKDPSLPVFQLWNLFADESEQAEMSDRCAKGGIGYGDVKKDLLARILDHFGDARARYEDIVARPDDLEDMLARGAARARERAAAVMEDVRRAAGLGARR